MDSVRTIAPPVTKNRPGEGFIQTLVDSCVAVIQKAAGGCAELKLSVEHEQCGWNADFGDFDKHLNALSKICGHSYDHCSARRLPPMTFGEPNGELQPP